MPIITKLIKFCLIIALAAQTSCTSGDKQRETDQNVENPTPDVIQRNPLDAEAGRRAQQYWDKTFTKCGDSYYSVGQSIPWNLYEHKGVTFVVTSEGISEAGRLNGFEWSGNTTASCQASREYDGGWKDWSGGPACSGISAFPPWAEGNRVSLDKRNGKWLYESSPLDHYNPKKINCQNIPR